MARGTFTPEGIRPVFDHPGRRYASGTAPYTVHGSRNGAFSVQGGFADMEAINSLRIVLAADHSVRTGEVVRL